MRLQCRPCSPNVVGTHVGAVRADNHDACSACGECVVESAVEAGAKIPFALGGGTPAGPEPGPNLRFGIRGRETKLYVGKSTQLHENSLHKPLICSTFRDWPEAEACLNGPRSRRFNENDKYLVAQRGEM